MFNFNFHDILETLTLKKYFFISVLFYSNYVTFGFRGYHLFSYDFERITMNSQQYVTNAYVYILKLIICKILILGSCNLQNIGWPIRNFAWCIYALRLKIIFSALHQRDKAIAFLLYTTATTICFIQSLHSVSS